MNSGELPPNQRLAAWLEYFNDIGLGNFYRDRAAPPSFNVRASVSTNIAAASVIAEPASLLRESIIASPAVTNFAAPALPPLPMKTSAANKPAAISIAPQASSLFEGAGRIAGDTLEKIRADIGDCTRCRLCEQRNKIVFGDGNAKAELLFIGEGPGRDEDATGLPFVGRAGKLLTQMIEAMGLNREQVYICNVVKCRPPDNRTPEKDEVATCSPFLLRQLDVIKPKVIVCLGNCAAQALLSTNRSLSSYRGTWLEFRGTKLMVTYHPAYLLRNPPAKADVWADLKKVILELGLPMPKSPAKSVAAPAPKR